MNQGYLAFAQLSITKNILAQDLKSLDTDEFSVFKLCQIVVV